MVDVHMHRSVRMTGYSNCIPYLCVHSEGHKYHIAVKFGEFTLTKFW